jgi:hypothetical protein
MMPDTADERPRIYLCQCGFGTDDAEWFEAHQRQHDVGRLRDVDAHTVAELEWFRAGLAASLALLRPNSPACIPIRAQMSAIDVRLAQLAAERRPHHSRGAVPGDRPRPGRMGA